MKKLLFICAAAAIMAGFSGKVMAQIGEPSATDQFTLQLDPMTDIAIANNGSNNLTFKDPTAETDKVPGDKIQLVTTTANSNINFTTIMDAEATPLKIMAEVTAGDDVPVGTTLKVKVGTIEGSSAEGDAGDPDATEGGIVLENDGANPSLIVSGIGSCHTGVGTSSGYPLIYTWEVTNYASVVAKTSNITVTYTVSE